MSWQGAGKVDVLGSVGSVQLAAHVRMQLFIQWLYLLVQVFDDTLQLSGFVFLTPLVTVVLKTVETSLFVLQFHVAQVQRTQLTAHTFSYIQLAQLNRSNVLISEFIFFIPSCQVFQAQR